jgi:putative ABC transport system permease protein
MRVTHWLDELRDDVRFAFRQLTRSPGFASVAVATLALGIGANSAIFALADATLLRPLAFPDADRLVMLHERTPTNDRGRVAPFEAADWAEFNRTFEAMAAMNTARRALIGADGSGEQIRMQMVGVQFFDVFPVRPIVGRTFVPSDDHPNPDALVLSEHVWRIRFGSDPDIVGRRIRIDSETFTVVGVVPDNFRVLAPSSAWNILPTAFARSSGGVAHFLSVIGRLRPGVTLADAQADMAAVAQSIAERRPTFNKDRGVLLEPLHDGIVSRDLQSTARLLLGVVIFVLLTCCANVANLVLTRTTSRTRELAARAALGAGRLRIVRLVLTESVVLSSIAAVLGAAIGAAIITATPSLLPAGVLPVNVTLAFDRRVLTFCAVTAFGLALAFGAAPAWHAVSLPPLYGLASASRTATGRGGPFRSLLATAQIAAAVVLLCGAGLLLRTLNALGEVDAGYRTQEALTMEVTLPVARPGTSPYAAPEARATFYDAVEREVRQLPGVRAAAWGSALPLDGFWLAMSFAIDGEPARPEAERSQAHYQHVSASYFQTLGIPIVTGRPFSSVDSARSAPVCIVNEAFVRRYLPDQAPLNARVVVRGMYTGAGALPVREIVGVVGQVKERPEESQPEPHIYVPIAQDTPWQASLIVRPATGLASALAPAVRAAVAGIDRERPVAQLRTLADIGHDATAAARFRATLVASFAGLALTLAIVGVFGVLAYGVQQRVREFGVRIALGATTATVVRLVVASTARVVAAGVLAGLVAAALLGRSMASFLFGVTPVDPMTFGSVALLLALTAACGAAVPALRAARVDPIVVLRDE